MDIRRWEAAEELMTLKPFKEILHVARVKRMKTKTKSPRCVAQRATCS